MFIKDDPFESLHNHYQKRWHAGQLVIVVQRHLDSRAIELGSSKIPPPPTIIEHNYMSDKDIVEIYRWNGSTDKALCFYFVDIVRFRLLKVNLLLSPRIEEPLASMSEFSMHDHEDTNTIWEKGIQSIHLKLPDRD